MDPAIDLAQFILFVLLFGYGVGVVVLLHERWPLP